MYLFIDLFFRSIFHLLLSISDNSFSYLLPYLFNSVCIDLLIGLFIYVYFSIDIFMIYLFLY